MSTRPAHRPSTRESMLAAAEARLRATGTVSLATAARAAGVSKTGLMYHFSTKRDLMTALLARLMTDHEAVLGKRLARIAGTRDPLRATATQRLTAYVEWVCSAEFDRAELMMLTDPRLGDALTQVWAERMQPWLQIPAGLPVESQARLLSARLLADGLWLAGATGSVPLTGAQKRRVKHVALDLIGGAQ